MADEKHFSTIELGAFASDPATSRITMIEVVALGLTVVWLIGVIYFFYGTDMSGLGEASTLEAVMIMLGIFVPVALIWVAASAAKTARILREESARLQSAIDAMRAAYVVQQQAGGLGSKSDVALKLEEIAEAQRQAENALATFTSIRKAAESADARAAVAHAPPTAETPQPTLGLGTPAEALQEPISVADFIKALNFPENENDKEGFRTLRRALGDPFTKRLIRASQDVLTLLSQDGIYMDDLRPDRAKPELWRKFAKGERGKAIAGLGGIRDRSSLALSSGRMKQDPVFRDAVHHFLRQFDKTLVDFEQNATDEEIIQMAETRTSRAFMLLGRVTGTFD
ncbi:hypothetical protein [Alterinioella nitratireducens]|jgi:hypothetical protein|uniref:hypothetical protein n=1 Tax=Alterinioella nitratireducens TaxID=2735915 RepID=UPI000C92D932|nr:hypothetical protein [Alterinioella nitratireducens]MAN15684.1 hypothetical protein [Dinoroseobacter sp.]NPD20073.1 hypothetical protein [Alterinioella nitratireducens]